MRSTRITPDVNHPGITLWRGFAVREDAAGTAVINFRLGSVTGDILFPLNLAADEAAAIFFGGDDDAIESAAGIFVEEVSGSITGTLYN